MSTEGDRPRLRLLINNTLDNVEPGSIHTSEYDERLRKIRDGELNHRDVDIVELPWTTKSIVDRNMVSILEEVRSRSKALNHVRKRLLEKMNQ